MKRYISDYHLGHSNIINSESRPFSSLDEMHETITTQRIFPASAGGGFYLSVQSEYNLRLNGSDSTNRLCLLKAEL